MNFSGFYNHRGEHLKKDKDGDPPDDTRGTIGNTKQFLVHRAHFTGKFDREENTKKKSHHIKNFFYEAFFVSEVKRRQCQ